MTRLVASLLALVAACGAAPPPSSPAPAAVASTPPVAAPPTAPTPVVALAPRKVPPGWTAMVDNDAGIAVAFPGASTTTSKQMAQGGRKGRMQEWAHLPDGAGYSVRMLWLEPSDSAAELTGMADQAINEALSMDGVELAENVPFKADGWSGRDVHLAIEGQYARLIVATSSAPPERMVSLFALVGRIQEVDRLGTFGDSLVLRP